MPENPNQIPLGERLTEEYLKAVPLDSIPTSNTFDSGFGLSKPTEAKKRYQREFVAYLESVFTGEANLTINPIALQFRKDVFAAYEVMLTHEAQAESTGKYTVKYNDPAENPLYMLAFSRLVAFAAGGGVNQWIWTGTSEDSQEIFNDIQQFIHSMHSAFEILRMAMIEHGLKRNKTTFTIAIAALDELFGQGYEAVTEMIKHS